MKNKYKKHKSICPFTGEVCNEVDKNCYKCLNKED